MAEGFKLLFLFSMVACLASGTAALETLYKSTSTLEESGPCGVNSCGQGSTCEPRANETFVCLCLAGDWYNNGSKSCEKAKVFPGQLILPGLQYQAQMNDTLSEEFLNGSERIIDSLKDVFQDSAGYLGSTVLKLEENKPESRLWSRAESGVIATVDIIFNSTADTTTEEVQQKVQNANCTDCPLAGANFTNVDLCKNDSRYPCDTATTESCSSVDGSYNCSCKDGYIPTNTSDRECIEENVSTTPSPTSASPGPCGVNSCGQGSTCEPRANETFVCLCLAGDWYNNGSKSCEKAKVFPGQLILPRLQYEAQMNDTLSEEFLNGSERIIDLLKDVFQDSAGYLGSTVLKLEENKPESRLWSRAESGVIATVDIIFNSTADTTTEQVQQKIENFTCIDCLFAGANFTNVDLCKNDSRYPCDTATTESCSSVDGSYNCSCKDGYIPTNTSDRECIEENVSTTPSPTSASPGPCEVNPCGQGSTCQPRANETFVCLCLAGDWYNSIRESCEKAKVFPGKLILPRLQYEAQMSDTLSEEFLNGSERIIDSLKDVFQDSAGYLGSTVLKLEENKPESRLWSRAESGVNATVDIIFNPTADIKTEEVQQKIENVTCTDCLFAGANFKSGNLCEKNSRYPCDETTTTCSQEDGSYNCSCNDGYLKTNFSDRMCIGCPGGQKVDDSQCVNCPFGYSGFNCTENWKLILVIVGSVLGGLLLITLILLPIVASISSKRSSKRNKNADRGNPVLSHSAAEALLVKRGLANSNKAAVNGSYDAYSDAGVPKIPRAMTPSSRNRTNLEMTHRNSQQNLNSVGRKSQMSRDEDDTDPYAQTLDGPHNNPYAMRRPQINPYASRQGQSNPSYIHDDGRGFNY